MGKVAMYVRGPPASSAIHQKKRKREPSEERDSRHRTEYMHSRRAHMTTSEHSRLCSRRDGDALRAHPISTSQQHPKRGAPSKSKFGSKEIKLLRSPIRIPVVPPQRALESPSGYKLPSCETVDDFLRSCKSTVTCPDETQEAHEEVTPPKCGTSPTTPSPQIVTSTKVDLGRDMSSPHIAPSFQLNLIYRGYPLTYNMSSLPDDPTIPLALLAATGSDPGAYLIIGAHYRRTGRSRAARSILQNLLDKDNGESGCVKNGNDRPRSSKWVSGPVCNFSIIRPALLMLAACELDISHENPMTAESSSYTSTAHELFRAVYGSAGTSIWTSSNGSGIPLRRVLSESISHAPSKWRQESAAGDSFAHIERSDSVATERISILEKELQEARDYQRQLIDDCTAAHCSLASMKTELELLQTQCEETLRLLVAEQEKQVMKCGVGGRKGLWGTLRNMLC
ncbi:hypothetical protein V8B97DRAFT_731622 [Scleroderma yunnanense]